MMPTNTPLLSICIPTYNRANLLDSALYSLMPQILDLGDTVELVVSDNCSPDNTADIVDKYIQLGVPIRYYRNERNLGAAKNILLLCNELALGEFCWVLGDDDIVRPDGLMRISSVLLKHSEVDYVFVNVSCKDEKERIRYDRPISGADFPELRPTKCKDLSERQVTKWEELIDHHIDDVFLGSIMCSVFRLRKWKEYELVFDADGSPFSSLALTYPHSMILANTMMGCASYYIGFPCIITFFGHHEWIGYLPIIISVRLQELLDLYRNLGVNRNRIERCRRQLLGYSRGAVVTLLLESKTMGREYFSLTRFIWQNRYHLRSLMTLIVGVVKASLRKAVVAGVKVWPALYHGLRELKLR